MKIHPEIRRIQESIHACDPCRHPRRAKKLMADFESLCERISREEHIPVEDLESMAVEVEMELDSDAEDDFGVRLSEEVVREMRKFS